MLSYSELITLPTFEERFEYLKIGATVGDVTFGHDRYLNQALYKSSDWRRIRDRVIVRDNGCDLAMPDREIYGTKIIIHHINPITMEDILNRRSNVFDLDNLICVEHNTHNALHYGDEELLRHDPVVRTPGDTKLW